MKKVELLERIEKLHVKVKLLHAEDYNEMKDDGSKRIS